MKQLKNLNWRVLHTLQEYEIIYVKMDGSLQNNSLTVILDHKTNSSKLKKLIDSLKAQRMSCQCSFNPETWELAVTISK